MARLITTIYMGPVRIEPIVELREGLFVLRDPITRQFIGYPKRKESFQIFFKINHLPSITQAMLRSHKNLECVVLWNRGRIHEGRVFYHNGDNALISNVTLKDHNDFNSQRL